jgi:sulfoxide reductase heme-binding subunit YedZ
MQRRLGKRWRSLHRSIYLIGILGVLHFFLQVKLDTSEPLLYALILAALLGFRVVDWLRRRHRRTQISKS